MKSTLGREELKREPKTAYKEELIGGVGVESFSCQQCKKETKKLDQKTNYLLQTAAFIRRHIHTNCLRQSPL